MISDKTYCIICNKLISFIPVVVRGASKSDLEAWCDSRSHYYTIRISSDLVIEYLSFDDVSSARRYFSFKEKEFSGYFYHNSNGLKKSFNNNEILQFSTEEWIRKFKTFLCFL